MSGNDGTKRGLVAASTALLVVVGLLAAFGASASAAPVHTDSAATTAWAYGGGNSASGSLTLGKLSASWNVSVDVVVIFHATPTVANTTELEEQRTLGVSVQVSLSEPNASLNYHYHAVEVDTAYANVSNDSTVYVGGAPVAALGIDNASYHGTATLAESLVATAPGKMLSAYLNVSADAKANVAFSPSLGVVPLDLTGVSSWNSSANATPSASWNFSYNYAFHGWNNTTASGHHVRGGNWTASGPVALHGEVVTFGVPTFRDHTPRTAIVISVTGPATIYEGFLVVPHGFDIFGGGPQPYSHESMSTVAVSKDMLFVTTGRHLGVNSLSASEVTVGGTQGAAQPMIATPNAAAIPSAGMMGTSVVAQPESVSAAQSQANCIQNGCGSTPWFSGLLEAAVIGGVVAAVAGTVGVVEWRSYARRKNQARQLVGGYSEGLASGFPPAASVPPTPSPQAPTSGPTEIEGPNRQP
ncbi:MAG TPA: hypothetical protein VMF04_05925 [Thermoplasmata archaeon]|nr:hypothetical protein [Thermoplasmata archaeon]